jgi:hypothetical protein
MGRKYPVVKTAILQTGNQDNSKFYESAPTQILRMSELIVKMA